jgi:tetratricopeptide (TPR) repeat protein
VLQQAVMACECGQFSVVKKLCVAILTDQPSHIGALYLLSVAQSRSVRFVEALSTCDRILAVHPDHAEALHTRGVAQQELKRFEEALASYQRAIAIRPDYAETHYNHALILQEQRRHLEALSAFDRALTIRANHAGSWHNRGNTLYELGRFEEAISSYDRALGIEPNRAATYYNCGHALQALARIEEAKKSFAAALALDPTHPYASSGLAETALKLCEWGRWDSIVTGLRQSVIERSAIVFPFVLLGFVDDQVLQLSAAQHFVLDRIKPNPQPLWRGERWQNAKIKLAYLRRISVPMPRPISSASFSNCTIDHASRLSACHSVEMMAVKDARDS